MEKIDLTGYPQNPRKSYLGANGAKKCIIINGVDYMVKFPSAPTKNDNISYANGCISEYIGCHIFEAAQIPVQETLLATYTTDKGKTKVVVACKDMTGPGIELKPFAGLKNQVVDSPQNGYGTELSEILQTFEEQNLFDVKIITERFWDMFVVDALIGNWDRHNGNWGYLYNSLNDTVSLAPVYDCGSALFPQADEDIMRATLSDKKEMDYRIYSVPLSSIKIKNKKINYHDFIKSLDNKDCNNALKRIFPRLDMEKINKIIEDTPYISNLQKDFYSSVMEKRREIILQRPYGRLINREKSQELPAVKPPVKITKSRADDYYPER